MNIVDCCLVQTLNLRWSLPSLLVYLGCYIEHHRLGGLTTETYFWKPTVKVPATRSRLAPGGYFLAVSSHVHAERHPQPPDASSRKDTDPLEQGPRLLPYFKYSSLMVRGPRYAFWRAHNSVHNTNHGLHSSTTLASVSSLAKSGLAGTQRWINRSSSCNNPLSCSPH